MKNELCLPSLVFVLLLLLVYIESGTALRVYRNNEYEVSEIDKRLDIPHPGPSPRRHRHGLRRNGIIVIDEKPEQSFFKRHHVTVPEPPFTIHQHNNNVLNRRVITPGLHGHKDGRGYKNGSEVTVRRAHKIENEDKLTKSDVTPGLSTTGASQHENSGHRYHQPIGLKRVKVTHEEKAGHELEFESDVKSLGSLVDKAEREIQYTRSHNADITGKYPHEMNHKGIEGPLLHRGSQHMGVRRQEIIHALNEENSKVEPEDDIESLGRRMDESGNEIKDSKYEQATVGDKHAVAATRYIISKIQEIQDKLFKRTGNKELEDKLNQMATGPTKKDKSVVALSKTPNKTLHTSKTNLTKPMKTAMENQSTTKEKDNDTKSIAQPAERRKIIPEEVVDKILEKFQQLKKEAKHIAVSASRHSVEHAVEDAFPVEHTDGTERKSEDDAINPYASIGKPPKNQTAITLPALPDSISKLLSARDTKIGTMQIPIGSFTGGDNNGAKKGVGPIPMMFIKSGGRLVPVFDSADSSPTKPALAPALPALPQMSVASDTRAQLDGNSGVAELNSQLMKQNSGVAELNSQLLKPRPVNEIKSSEQSHSRELSMADHVLGNLNVNSGVAQPNIPLGMLSNFQASVNQGKEGEASRSRALSMAEHMLDTLNLNSGVTQPNFMPSGLLSNYHLPMNQGKENEGAHSREPNMPLGLLSNFQTSNQGKDEEEARARELSITDHLLDKLNVNSGIAQPNFLPSNLLSMVSNLKLPQSEPSVSKGNFGNIDMFPNFKMPQSEPSMNEGNIDNKEFHKMRSNNHQSPSSRCVIPGYNCDDLQTRLRHKSEDKYENPSIPSTEEIIQNVLRSPDFPSVAAKILHNSAIRQDKKPLSDINDLPTGESKYHSGDRGKYSDSDYPSRLTDELNDSPSEKSDRFSKELLASKYRPDETLDRDRYFSSPRHSVDDTMPREGERADDYMKQAMFQNPAPPPTTSFFQPQEKNVKEPSHDLPPRYNNEPVIPDMNGQLDALRNQQVLSFQDMNQPSSSNYQGLSPGAIQFNMQHNLAQNLPGEISMIDNRQNLPILPESGLGGNQNQNLNPLSDDLQKQMDSLQVAVPFGQTVVPQASISNRESSTRHFISGSKSNNQFQSTLPGAYPRLGINDGFTSNIASNENDPMSKMDFAHQQLAEQTPDQLLEYAKQKAFQQNYQSTRMDRFDRDFKESESDNMNTETSLPVMSHVPSVPRGLSKDPTELLDLIHHDNIPGAEIGRMRSEVPISSSEMGNFPLDLKEGWNDISRYEQEHSPDALLETLRKQRNKDMRFLGDYMDPETATKYRKARYNEEYAKSRGQIPSAADPSFADYIKGGDDMNIEVQSKALALQGRRSSRLLGNAKNTLSNRVSFFPGDIVQYNHGKMASDPANVINSFFKDNKFNYRNDIPRPTNSTDTDGIPRASIIHTLPHDHIELTINGKKITQGHNSRRSKLGNKSQNPNGETIFSKGTIQLELSHGEDNKRKIINIVTSSPFNVTDDRKRTHIAKNVHN